MMAVDIASDSVFVPGAPRIHLEELADIYVPVRRYDVFPDGSIITALQYPEDEVEDERATEIHVVLNIVAELAERGGN